MEWEKGKASCTNRFLSVIKEINGKYFFTVDVCLPEENKGKKSHTAGHCYLS
jgi:hypothetical protein